ncbi:cysteine peptidase family C39 domain-containing protein, partial [Robertkochia marina]
MLNGFPFYKQPDSKDCGPTCLRIISKYYGKIITLQEIRDLAETSREGSNLMKLSDAAEAIGFKSIGVKIDFEKLSHAPLPLIIHWKRNHFVVVYKVKKDSVYISDPSYGLIKYHKKEFLTNWIGEDSNDNTKEGIALLLETSTKFKDAEWDTTQNKSLKFLFKYLLGYKKLIVQLILGLSIGSLLQLIFPFLTQSIV